MLWMQDTLSDVFDRWEWRMMKRIERIKVPD